jgi:hypothetical protein
MLSAINMAKMVPTPDSNTPTDGERLAPDFGGPDNEHAKPALWACSIAAKTAMRLN